MRIDHSELVLAIVDGAVHRYGELVQLFDDRVRRFVSQRISDPAAIEDLVQEIFYKAFKQIGKLNDPARFESWLLTISRHCVVDYFRASLSRRRICSELNESSMLSADSGTDRHSDWVWEEVDRLQVEFRDVLKMRYRFSLTYEEISQRMELPVSTIRGRIHEARKALRQRLENKGLYP